MSKLRLDGNVAIITGAASGVGEAAARLFVRNSALVIVADIQDKLGHQVVASIGLDKENYRHCNVTDEKQVEDTVAYALEWYGTIDILFSNAGILESATDDILKLVLEAFNTTMAVNVLGAAMMIKHISCAMVAHKIRGSIICTASVGEFGGFTCAYTESKHAILGPVRSVCSKLGPYGIRVNCVSPFGLATPMKTCMLNFPSLIEAGVSGMTNLKGIASKANHIAEAALFLASDESSFASGHDLIVDSGITAVHQSTTTYAVSLLSR